MYSSIRRDCFFGNSNVFLSFVHCLVFFLNNDKGSHQKCLLLFDFDPRHVVFSFLFVFSQTRQKTTRILIKSASCWSISMNNIMFFPFFSKHKQTTNIPIKSASCWSMLMNNVVLFIFVRINDPNQRIESITRINELIRWIKSKNRINDSSHLIESINRINELKQWIESTSIIKEPNQ